MKNFILTLACLCGLLYFIHVTETRAHPDGATPFWYPSAWIYGFVDGCAGKIEEEGATGKFPWVNSMWPENIRSICGCTVDALRHGFTFQEVEGDSKRVQSMVDITLPVCIDEERRNL